MIQYPKGSVFKVTTISLNCGKCDNMLEMVQDGDVVTTED